MVWHFPSWHGADKAAFALDEFVSAVAVFDPGNAGRAQISLIRAELNTLAERLLVAETDLGRARRRTEVLQRRYVRYLEAAHRLERQLDRVASDARRRELEGSLASLIDQLERMQAALSQARAGDRAAAAWTAGLRAAVNDLGAKLHGSATDRSAAGGSVTRSRGRVSRREREASAGAGLTMALSAISVTQESMNRERTRMRAEHEALERQAERLREDRLEQDPNIAAALGLGVAPDRRHADASALRDRLSRLESEPAAPAASAA